MWKECRSNVEAMLKKPKRYVEECERNVEGMRKGGCERRDGERNMEGMWKECGWNVKGM